MAEYGKDWLTARAREGTPAPETYRLDEAYLGERDELIAELRTALMGCEEPEKDRLGNAMLGALRLNALPVLRAVVAIWRDAYLGLLTQIEEPKTADPGSTLTAAEIDRLATVKRRAYLRARDGGR